MARCHRIIGRYLPHTCNREIEGPNPPPLNAGRCAHCGVAVGDSPADSEFDAELDFSSDELDQFGVYLECTADEGCNPPEWGENGFTDFT